MAGEWRELPFSEAVLINPATAMQRGREYPFVDMGALNPGLRCAYPGERRMFDGGGSRFVAGDTLMARITPCLENGKIARYSGPEGEPAHGSTEFIVIRGREGVSDTAFAYYLTKWDGVSGYAISQMTGTSGRQRVPTTTLDHLTVLLPPLPEQRAIAHILGTLDDKIELNRKMAATLEAMARALFKAWFVDFEPVRAKQEGRDPGLPPHIADLFPDRLVETEEIVEIPAGWRLGNVGDIAENPRRAAQPSDIPVGTAYIALEHMPRRSLALDQWAEADGVESNKHWFERSDVLFGKLRPYFHKVGIAPLDGVCSTDIVVLRPKSKEYWSYLALIASSVEFVAFTDQSSTGTKMPRTNWSDMSRYDIVLAPPQVLNAFDRIVRPLLDKIAMSVHESRALAALRDALLPKLVSGELRVKDAKKFLERAL